MTIWPQVTYLILLGVGFGVNLARFGKPRNDEIGFIDLIIAPAVGFALLWYGGFFAPLGWTQ